MQQFIDSYDFKGKKAIVRVDFNVPLNENFEITDDTRIRAALPTLKKVLAGGGALIIMSHLGRPKKVDPKFSLKHILAHVSELLGVPVQFAEDCQKAQAQAAALKPGEVLLLENLRVYAEEDIQTCFSQAYASVNEQGGILFCVGSLYLIGKIKNIWEETL